ncbi:MAG TPA: HD domain-containing phosphohydrolase [Pirellulales bacterium]|nr:HD domain-containing phosphohydrolase [Pirellulales bacterium]
MPPPAALAAPACARDAAAVAGRLRDCLGVDFSVLEGATGDPVRLAADHRRMDWTTRAELCREVARRGQPEMIEEDDPWLLLAVPVPRGDETLVAVAPLLTRPATSQDTLRLAENLGLDLEAAADWAARQEPLPAEAAVRLATVSAAKLTADEEIEQLEEEVEKLSAHLGSTFEEISLIYRLTQNLKLSSNDEDLGRRALEWLSEVVPAEALVLLLIPNSDASQGTPDVRTQPLLLKHGQCDLAVETLLELVERLGLRANNRPLVVNHLAQVAPGARFASVRELVIVPVAEGEHLFGWLAAINHDRSGEFGSAEASLLSSVGTMLGIHSGNIDLYRQQAELLTGVVRAMSSAIDAKDPYTRGHSDRVARIAVRLAKELNCDAETVKTIYFSGLLHDIGKIGINDEVLRKPGKLTDEEFEHIKQHVLIGYRILADLRKLSHMLPVVLHHHESWDGKGYPHGLAAEGIPYLARIVAVADAYDAMASDRPYRAGMEDEKLDEIIRKGAGQQWDPQVVEAFFRARDDIRAISSRGALSAEAPEPSWQ